MSDAIQIPLAARERLEQYVMQRAQLDAVIEATVQTLREVLNVPDNYTLTDIRSGFVLVQGVTDGSNH